MSAPAHARWWPALAKRISRRVGFALRGREMQRLLPTVGELMRRAGVRSWEEYVAALDASPLHAPIWQALLDHVVIRETSLFRHGEQFDFLRSHILRGHMDELKCWSAGCSTGEEAFSLAICCLEEGLTHAEIWGTDISLSALQTAAQGRILTRQNQPSHRLARWLEIRADGCYVTEPVRTFVRWQWNNLLEADGFVLQHGPFDVIMCRNVLLYFHEEAIERVLRLFERALKPDGWLLLGHAESLLFRQTPFHMVAGGLAYTRRAPARVSHREKPEPQAAAQTPRDPHRAITAAMMLEQQRRPLEAAALLQEVLRGDERNLLVRLCLSGIYRRAGKIEAAARELMRLAGYLAGRPDDELVPGGDGLTIGALRRVVAPYVGEDV